MAGDWNCIVETKDATHYQDQKMSQNLKRLLNMLEVIDLYRALHPYSTEFSHYYEKQGSTNGGTRLDRIYITKNIVPVSSEYKFVAMSDHLMQHARVKIRAKFEEFSLPKPRPHFKIKPKVVDNIEFQQEISDKLEYWEWLRGEYNYNLLEWWEFVVKKGI